MKIKEKKEKKPRTKDAKFKLFTKIVALLMVALMLLSAVSSFVYYLVAR